MRDPYLSSSGPGNGFHPDRAFDFCPPGSRYEPPPPSPYHRGEYQRLQPITGNHHTSPSLFTTSKETPQLRDVASVGGTGRIQGLPPSQPGASSHVESETYTSVSHMEKAQRSATRLFISQPESQSTETEAPAQVAPVAPVATKVDLYAKLPLKDSRPTEKDMLQSQLFKSFGQAAVVQGMEDTSPRFALDPAQRASLQHTLRAENPSKLKAVPTQRGRTYPVHESSVDFLQVQELDPVFLSAQNARTAGLLSTDPLVITRAGEAMDKQLKQPQQAVRTGLVAACSLQQGLGQLKDLVASGRDPAEISSLLEEIFLASQDVVDQLGRSSALLHYARRHHILKAANLAGTEFQDPLLHLPLREGWLFGEDIRNITEKCSAQRAVVKGMQPSKRQQAQSQRTSQQSRQQPQQVKPRSRQQPSYPVNHKLHSSDRKKRDLNKSYNKKSRFPDHQNQKRA